MTNVLFFVLDLLYFSYAPTYSMYTSFLLSAESCESLHHRKPLGCRGSAYVEVMTTLHGNTSSFQRHVRGCIPLEGTIALTKDPFKTPQFSIKATLTL